MRRSATSDSVTESTYNRVETGCLVSGRAAIGVQFRTAGPDNLGSMGSPDTVTTAVPRSKRDSGSASSPTATRSGEEAGGPRCVVVMYHYVHDRPPTAELGVAGGPTGVRGLTSCEFEEQLDLLGREMEPVDWPTLYAWSQGRAPIPERCFLLTFDDGLADHAAVVAPILKRRGLRGVFFVPGLVLTSQRILSAHAIHLLLSRLDDQTLEDELTGFLSTHGGGTDWATLLDPQAAQAMYHYETAARARLKYLLTVVVPADLRNAALDSLFARYVGSAARWARKWYLSWDDLAGMQATGHTIGAHGYAHEPYTRMAPERVRDDMIRSAGVLRNGLGPDIRPLSYPYGRFDGFTAAAARGVGFAHAFTTQQRWVTGTDDLLLLPRVDTIRVGSFLREEVPCRVS